MLPERIKIGWRDYTVIESDEIFNDDGVELRGQINCMAETIEIDSELSEKMQGSVLFHELIHHCLYATGKTEHFADEGLVCALSEQLMQLFSDNPYLIHQLFNLGGVKDD